MWVPRDQTQPGSFSREREEPGNEVELKFERKSMQLFHRWPNKAQIERKFEGQNLHCLAPACIYILVMPMDFFGSIQRPHGFFLPRQNISLFVADCQQRST